MDCIYAVFLWIIFIIDLVDIENNFKSIFEYSKNKQIIGFMLGIKSLYKY
jgi:hypothetical protein